MLLDKDVNQLLKDTLHEKDYAWVLAEIVSTYDRGYKDGYNMAKNLYKQHWLKD